LSAYGLFVRNAMPWARGLPRFLFLSSPSLFRKGARHENQTEYDALHDVAMVSPHRREVAPSHPALS
jgi:hypothetical protein